MSSAFVNASLLQLQAAAQLPFGGISETATNAALALIEAAAPRNEVEGALAVQMACTHAAAMSVLADFGAAAALSTGWWRRSRPFAASATAETNMSASSTSTAKRIATYTVG